RWGADMDFRQESAGSSRGEPALVGNLQKAESDSRPKRESNCGATSTGPLLELCSPDRKDKGAYDREEMTGQVRRVISPLTSVRVQWHPPQLFRILTVGFVQYQNPWHLACSLHLRRSTDYGR